MKFFYKLFHKTGTVFYRISDLFVDEKQNNPETQSAVIQPSAADQEWGLVINKWFADKGDESLRLNYDLNENSIVVDVGGYKGDWTANIFVKYACNVYIFEPVPLFAEMITKRFIPNKKNLVFTMGLGDETKEALISMQNDGSSIYRSGGIQISARFMKASDFINEQKITHTEIPRLIYFANIFTLGG